MLDGRIIDSESTGDPARFLSLDLLAPAFAALSEAPRDRGSVALIVRRSEEGRRETPGRVRLVPGDGIPGDAWGRREHKTLDGSITVMQAAIAELMANGQPLVLFGDNLFLDLDLSTSNLGVGSRVRVGTAILEVTPKPHSGCGKFSGRFGVDALRLTATPEGRARRARGLYMRVVEAGDVSPGDAVEVLQRVSTDEEPSV
ncbi:MAG: hypothetical protein L0221_01600 [Chloroflexi bacterium]|nr:hypothetical protein [Chloroflexota bacterium]